MIEAFRVSELKNLLGFLGVTKSGSKVELQRKALNLLKLHSTAVELKIKELYKFLQ
jgi:hypothetical protein